MRAKDFITEVPLPPDWDESKYKPGTSFKSRLQYAVDRAKKLGTGSSRVAMIIEYQGRPTVLKVAKNKKGLSQNAFEVDILNDYYAASLDIFIPIIDWDNQNPSEPAWIQTELAQKATEKQLCSLMKCPSLSILVEMADLIAGNTKRYYQGHSYSNLVEILKSKYKMSEADIETMTEYANTLADASRSFDMPLGDFTRKANWGIYKGKPVIIDAGLSEGILKTYYLKK
jgi:hypothetical protein